MLIRQSLKGMPNKTVSREFQISDYADAVKLWNKVEGVEIAEGDSEQEIERYLSQNRGLSRIAHDGGTTIGVALCGHDGRRGFIYHLAIDPAYHQRGVGRQLVAECLDGLRKVGLKRALILVAADNPQGQAFWQRCGWEEVSGAEVMGIDL